MRPAFIVVLVIALAMAGVTGVLMTDLLKPPPVTAVTQAAVAPPKPKTIGVLVAGSALEVGRALTPDNMEWQEWPDGVLRRDQGIAMATNEQERAEVLRQYDGTVLRSPMVRNEPFSEDKVIRPAGGGVLALVLAPGMRSTTISVSAVSGAGGMVQPGDRVDLLLTMDLADPQAGEVNAVTRIARPKVATETILTNLKVLSRDRSLNASSTPDSPVPTAVTFEVTPQQAETIATAARIGTFSLIMRSLRNGEDPERVGIPVTTDVQVVPGLQASRRNIPLSQLDQTENPFVPPVPKVAVKPLTEPNKALGSIIINRGTSQQVVPTVNGKVVGGDAAARASQSGTETTGQSGNQSTDPASSSAPAAPSAPLTQPPTNSLPSLPVPAAQPPSSPSAAPTSGAPQSRQTVGATGLPASAVSQTSAPPNPNANLPQVPPGMSVPSSLFPTAPGASGVTSSFPTQPVVGR